MAEKYTEKVLRDVVSKSTSMSDVIKQLGKKWSGGLHGHLTAKVKRWTIDVSHFSIKGCNRGKTPSNKLHWTDVLVVITSEFREESFRLRRALLESGRKYECEECSQSSAWNGKELRLQIDHKDGNWKNNLPSNLRFLCPNCHSQTETFGSKNIATVS
jgi:hypothetical protein